MLKFYIGFHGALDIFQRKAAVQGVPSGNTSATASDILRYRRLLHAIRNGLDYRKHLLGCVCSLCHTNHPS
ncbi:hypothetical protein J2W94_001626 [Pseudoxanthomonas sacheonensis]|uniref:Uncharacterized protein n=1 Tax=Pseudoxanthomonas sacheonensis TaxID=443615 RepID=A0ABU1RRF1_9GAMM|nr:hypothetical protein [Pseudoxanthomonas sacheonensis]